MQSLHPSRAVAVGRHPWFLAALLLPLFVAEKVFAGSRLSDWHSNPEASRVLEDIGVFAVVGYDDPDKLPKRSLVHSENSLRAFESIESITRSPQSAKAPELKRGEFRSQLKELRGRRLRITDKVRDMEKRGNPVVRHRRVREPWTPGQSRDWDWEKAETGRSFPATPNAEKDLVWRREMEERSWNAFETPTGMVINPRRAPDEQGVAIAGSRLAAFRYQLREDYPRDGLPPCPPVKRSDASRRAFLGELPRLFGKQWWFVGLLGLVALRWA